jgi:hypothetical protein
MLEEADFLVHAWSRHAVSNGESAWIRNITNSSSKQLGFVRFDGDPERSWWSWLRQVRLDIFETEDASHLLTILKNWGVLGSWIVQDAEGNHVGNLYSSTIITSEPLKIARIDIDANGNGAIRDMATQPIARVVQRADGVQEIAFTSEMSSNPFVRMLVLASVLTIAPTPPT